MPLRGVIFSILPNNGFNSARNSSETTQPAPRLDFKILRKATSAVVSLPSKPIFFAQVSCNLN